MHRRHLLLITSLLLPLSVAGQITIGEGTNMTVVGTLTTNTDLINNVTGISLSLERSQLVLAGQDQQISTPARLTVGRLIIDGGGTKTVSGQWEITNSLILNNGVVTTSDAQSRIVFSGQGSPETISANENSYVDGFFYSKGTQFRKFPVGSGGTYAPAALENIGNGEIEIGMRTVNGSSGLVGTVEMEEVLSTRYWEIDAPNPVNTKVALSTNDLNDETAWIVVQGSSTDLRAQSLGGSSSPPFIISNLNVTMPIVTLAIPSTFDISIHDLITPFTEDEANDVLLIDNINLTEENTVTLLDRWGVSHRVWKNYDNANPQFDFKKLSPGNYICIVEYKLPGSSEMKKKSQMITVLRTN